MFGTAVPKLLWKSQELSSRLNRIFLSCFGECDNIAYKIHFPKSKGGGEFKINCMVASFNKEAMSGEFYLEFDEKVWEHKVAETFAAHGATQIMTTTFPPNDAHESAAAAIVRVLENQMKTGLSYQRGQIPPALLAKVKAKQEAAKKLVSIRKEEEEKINLATQESLKLNYAKLETIETNVQSQGVKLDGIQHGVCQVIPDKQKEIDTLKEALAHKTKLCDSMEGKVAYKTRIINQHEIRIAQFEQENLDHIAERQAWITEKAALLEQLEAKKNMQNLIDNLKYVSGLLSTTLAEERASKRAKENND